MLPNNLGEHCPVLTKKKSF